MSSKRNFMFPSQNIVPRPRFGGLLGGHLGSHLGGHLGFFTKFIIDKHF